MVRLGRRAHRADLRARLARLTAALAAAAHARQHGLGFVVAPLPCADGALVRLLPGAYALALYPHVVGEAGAFDDRLAGPEAADLVGMLCALHAVPLAPRAGTETFVVADRGHLEAAVGEVAERRAWQGPFGARLRSLLEGHARIVTALLTHHDRLVETAGPQRDRLVLTHGEPHPGNLVRTPDGLVLVDWDTALVAPPERDLWLADARTGGTASAAYSARTGTPVDGGLLARYELAWALADLGSFLSQLRRTTEETSDTCWQWEAFHGTLLDLAQSPAWRTARAASTRSG